MLVRVPGLKWDQGGRVSYHHFEKSHFSSSVLQAWELDFISFLSVYLLIRFRFTGKYIKQNGNTSIYRHDYDIRESVLLSLWESVGMSLVGMEWKQGAWDGGIGASQREPDNLSTSALETYLDSSEHWPGGSHEGLRAPSAWIKAGDTSALVWLSILLSVSSQDFSQAAMHVVSFQLSSQGSLVPLTGGVLPHSRDYVHNCLSR